MKKAILLLSLVLMCGKMPEVCAAENLAKAAQPEVEAKGAILMEFDTGRILFEKDADIPLANASTTKIMTAILVIEKCKLSDVVTASKKAATTPPVKMYIQAGEKQTVETLLYALMLESANDSAVALAEHVGGSVQGFAALMNEKAKEIGAVNTKFVTPNGLDADGHYTTARDMALIAKYALGNKDFQRIIKTPYVSTPVGGGDYKPYSFVNKDRLLNEFEGALGIKTGYTGGAGHCFVGAAKRNGMMIISVVLGSGWGNRGKEQKWIDTKKLLNYGFDNYQYVVIAKEGDLIKKADVLHSKGKSVNLMLKNGITLPLSKEEQDNVRLVCSLPETLDAPLAEGQAIGTATVLVNDKSQAVIDIVCDMDIERHDFNISVGKILNSWFNMDYKAVYE